MRIAVAIAAGAMRRCRVVAVGGIIADVDALNVLSWSTEARRELPDRARGRRLVLDYFATRCCGRNVSVGDLHLRWTAADHLAGDFTPMRAPVGLQAFVQQDLPEVLASAGARIAMRGWGRFRHPVVELEDGAAWLDFIGACRTRSPLRH